MRPKQRLFAPTPAGTKSPIDREFRRAARRRSVFVNDTHSALNRTPVARLIEPRSVDDVVRAVREARAAGNSLAVAGGRHAMGGQQFLARGALLDMRSLNRVRRL